jgi:hypothetical protein
MAIPGTHPFDFANKTYPWGLFVIQAGTGSGPPANSGEFVIKDSTKAFGVDAMFRQGLIYIDEQKQSDFSRLNVTYDENGYTHIKLK